LQERAALAWAEALTVVAMNDIADALHDEVRAHFDDREMVDSSMAIITAGRSMPGGTSDAAMIPARKPRTRWPGPR